MRIRVLGGSGGMSPGHLLTSFRINDDTILDAGSMAQSLPLEDQVRIRHVLLTHAHLDHSGTLPFFVDNIFGVREDAFVVYSTPESVQQVRDHLFNNAIWPDFSMLPDFKRAAMRFAELKDEEPTPVGALTVTAVRVHHTVPAVGYIVDDGQVAVLFTGDTAQTDRIWQLASKNPRLKAAFIETSFPNRMQGIADISGHLTPQTLRAELPKLEHDVPKLVYHIKPRFHDEVVDELKRLGVRDLSIVEDGLDYDF